MVKSINIIVGRATAVRTGITSFFWSLYRNQDTVEANPPKRFKKLSLLLWTRLLLLGVFHFLNVRQGVFRDAWFSINYDTVNDQSINSAGVSRML